MNLSVLRGKKKESIMQNFEDDEYYESRIYKLDEKIENMRAEVNEITAERKKAVNNNAAMTVRELTYKRDSLLRKLLTLQKQRIRLLQEQHTQKGSEVIADAGLKQNLQRR